MVVSHSRQEVCASTENENTVEEEAEESINEGSHFSNASDACSDDGWSDENDHPATAGNEATLLINDYTSQQIMDRTILVAPGEENRPMGLLTDKYFEELSPPCIYAGQPCQDCPISYNALCRWELHNRDRRAARSPTNIFMKFRKLQALNLCRAAWTRIRKTKAEGRILTASMMLDSAQRNEIMRTSIGWTDLKQLRGSPQYYEQGKKDLFAMLRQLGVPTFFITNSMADTAWPKLLQALAWQVDRRRLTRAEVLALSWEERARLVRSDPVTCARYYRMRMETLIKTIRACPNIIGDLKDFFLRDESQHRGSPHTHWLAYVNEAPIFGQDPDEKICSWLDNFITCSSKNSSVQHLLDLQIHRHKKSCRRKKNGVICCRFNYPLPPMDKTRILYPLPSNTPRSELQSLRSIAESVQATLWRFSKAKDPEACPLGFEQFLSLCNVNLQQYLLAIRSTLKKPTIFLERRLCEIRINPYNPKLLELTEANMTYGYSIRVRSVCCGVLCGFLHDEVSKRDEQVDAESLCRSSSRKCGRQRLFETHGQCFHSCTENLR
jgi:hypothetical protein